MPVDTPAIVLDDASFGYADRTVVSEVTLTIGHGEAIALLGPNGSGKSTLVKGLLGLADQRGGHVEVLGEPLEHRTRRYHVGYVPQRHSLASTVPATVREIVAVGRTPQLRWHGRLSAEDRAAIAEAIDQVGLTDLADHDTETLSGGQQRRVLIARALAARPEVLILDEPTAGVDDTSQRQLAAVLRDIKTHGRTLLIVTHELDALHGIPDRALVVSSGRIVYDGPPAGLEPSHVDREGSHHHAPGPELRPGAWPGPFDAPYDPRHDAGFVTRPTASTPRPPR